MNTSPYFSIQETRTRTFKKKKKIAIYSVLLGSRLYNETTVHTATVARTSNHVHILYTVLEFKYNILFVILL